MNTIEQVTKYKSLANNPSYDLVSFCPNSIPSAGSPCRSKEGIDPDYPVVTLWVVNHRSGDVTIKTRTMGYIRFWKVIK